MNKILTSVAATILVTGASSAALVGYSTDFTSTDGFSDAGTTNGVDGWVTRPQNLTNSTGSYGAMEINVNGPSMVAGNTGGSFGVGDSVTITTSVFYTGNTQNNKLRIGLFDTLSNGAAMLAGLQFTMDATADGNFDIDGFAQGGGSHDFGGEIDSGLNYSVGQAVGETVITTFTKTNTVNEFDVEWSFRGGASSGTFTVTNATLYGATTVYGGLNYNGPVSGETQIDGFALTYTAVPEPSAMLLLSGLGLLALRRRR